MFRKNTTLFTLASAVYLIAAGAQASKADQSFVNAHTWTKPTATTSNYYWIRCVSDTTWGINGFIYLSSAKNTYYVLPTDVSWPSSSHVVLSAVFQYGPKKIPALLKTELWTSGGTNYASFRLTSVAEPGVVLDSSLPIKTDSGYVKLYVPRSLVLSAHK